MAVIVSGQNAVIVLSHSTDEKYGDICQIFVQLDTFTTVLLSLFYC